MPVLTHAARLYTDGEVEFRAQWFLDNGSEVYAEYGASAAQPDQARAKPWASNNIPCPRDESGQWWVRIERGVWRADEFEDNDYGPVLDMDWIPDDDYEQQFGFVVPDPVRIVRIDWHSG